jgi:allophanate hydrolase subunit 2
MRCYLALRGGLRSAQDRQLGSFSTDLLSGLGPPVLAAGTTLFGADMATSATVDASAGRGSPPAPVTLPVRLGPREDELSAAGLRSLLSSTFTVSTESNRVGLRLTGAPLERRSDRELPSEGLVTGAIQLPPHGHPVVFGPDHPTTGGYPVVAVVRERALDLLAQLRPAALVRFSRG